MADEQAIDFVGTTTDLASAYLSNNRVSIADVPAVIVAIHDALRGLGDDPATEDAASAKPTPAVSVRKSTANPNRIISMIDGKPYVSLKRHIGWHGYTPASYRETFDLPAAYPMTAVAYTEQRRAIAKRIGLGRRKADPAPISEPAPAAPARRRLKVKTD